MKKLNLLLIAVFAIILASCGKKNDQPKPDPTNPTEFLAHSTWKLNGFYAKGQKVPGAIPNLQLKFINSILKTININGNAGTPATWLLSNDGKKLTISYPSGYAEGKISAAQKEFDVTVSKTDLVFINKTEKPIEILGIFTLPANYEMKFSPLGSDPKEEQNVTSTDLTTGTWTANKEGAGFYTKGNTGVEAGKKVDLTFKFRTVFGLNTLSVGGVPTPTTWSLSADKKTLTLKTPSKDGFDSRDLAVSITKDKLIFTAEKEFTLYGVLKFNSTNELRMLQQ